MSLYITGRRPYGAIDRLAKATNASYGAFLSEAEDITSKVPYGVTPGSAMKLIDKSAEVETAMAGYGAMNRMLLEMEQKKSEALQEIPS